ncbi:MAG: hypothetical protein QXO71_08780 [Candidatus Jordarchaeaceae archaeon]
MSFISGILINMIKVPEAFTNAIGTFANSYVDMLKGSSFTLDTLYDVVKSYTSYLGQAINFIYLSFILYALGIALLIAGIVWIYQNQ